jgi:hypothetical protein
MLEVFVEVDAEFRQRQAEPKRVGSLLIGLLGVEGSGNRRASLWEGHVTGQKVLDLPEEFFRDQDAFHAFFD